VAYTVAPTFASPVTDHVPGDAAESLQLRLWLNVPVDPTPTLVMPSTVLTDMGVLPGSVVEPVWVQETDPSQYSLPSLDPVTLQIRT
jgi:hypothetical protein